MRRNWSNRFEKLQKKSQRAREAHSDVHVLDARTTFFDDDHRSTDATAIGSDVDRLLLNVDVDADELIDTTSATQATELLNEAVATSCQSEHVTVQVHDQMAFRIDFGSV